AALSQFELAVVEHQALLPADHVLFYSVQINRARALQAVGRTAEARAEVRRLLPLVTAKGEEAAGPLEGLRQLAASLGVAD
ncbi:MAG: hypothetical protein QG573_2556, partial [Acidobacteriota bacterium]|nr:hypothetical protein [Acidobacteriota bacterium]